jgi:hypothetical protein
LDFTSSSSAGAPERLLCAERFFQVRSLEERAVRKYLNSRDTDAEDAKANDEWCAIPPFSDDPGSRHVASRKTSNRLQNDDYQKKNDVSADQPRHDAFNGLAFKEVGLLAAGR